MPKIGVYPWARAFSIALEKENVLIYSITRIPERENKFKWVGTIAPVKVNLYKLKRRKDISIKSLDDAKKYLVGVARNDSKHQYLERKGFKINASEIVVKDELNLRKLTAERLDLVPFEEMRLVHVCNKTDGLNIEDFEKVLELPEISLEVSIAFSKKTPDSLVNKFKSALTEMKKNGTHSKILKSYLSRVRNNFSLSFQKSLVIK